MKRDDEPGNKAGGGARRSRAKTADPRTSTGGKRGFYIAVVVLLVAGIGTLSYLAMRSRESAWVVDPALQRIPNQGHVIGSDSALLEVVEFADFECPACGSFANLSEPDVRRRLVNTGLIRFRFVDFPLEIHRNTRFAHNAAWCASEQGRFWEMHDLIFQNQDRWSSEATRSPNEVLTQLAGTLGIDMARYSECVDTRKYAGQIQANVEEALRRQVQSTPTFFFGNTRVATALPYDAFKRYVDQALEQSAGRPAASGAAAGGRGTKAGSR